MSQLTRAFEYITNTGGSPTVAQFDEDHEPIGPQLREQLRAAHLAIEVEGQVRLISDILEQGLNTINEGKRELQSLRIATRHLLTCIDTPPDANCSCHQNPPCSDCVDYGGLREAISDVEALLQ